jgi:ATP-dependent protease ClpP protease subunit
MKKWYKITARDDSAEVSIFGDIGSSWWGDSVTLADFKAEFDKIRDKAEIRVLLNSPGGDVMDGMGIYNLLSGVRQKVTIEVLGMAASIASIIALAGKELVMGEGSFYMIHNPITFALGGSGDLRKAADLLDTVRGQMVGIYAQRTALTSEEIEAAMDGETWYTAEQAVEAGFASSVADYGDTEMVASYDISKYRYAHVPVEMIADEKPSEMPANIREFEDRVRGMGFSKREAVAIASHGFAHRDDAEAEAEPKTESEKQAPRESASASLAILLIGE